MPFVLTALAVTLLAAPPAEPAQPVVEPAQPVVEPAPPAAEPSKPTVEPAKTVVWWRFRGSLSDGAGTVRFRMRGTRVSHASAEVFGTSYVLRASEVIDGRFSLSGNQDKDYIKIKARVRRGGRWISGSWSGSVKRKRKSGRFTASRR